MYMIARMVLRMAEYIERGALQKRLEMHQATNPAVIGKKQFREGYYLGLSEAEIMIAQAPKSDVAPVRHGRWIDCEDDWSSYVRCSVCGDEYTNWEADCAYTNFCPGCGADMREGGTNDAAD